MLKKEQCRLANNMARPPKVTGESLAGRCAMCRGFNHSSKRLNNAGGTSMGYAHVHFLPG